MTIPTKAEVGRLFQIYQKAAMLDELNPVEIAKLKSAYQNANTRRINFKLSGGVIERKEN